MGDLILSVNRKSLNECVGSKTCDRSKEPACNQRRSRSLEGLARRMPSRSNELAENLNGIMQPRLPSSSLRDHCLAVLWQFFVRRIDQDIGINEGVRHRFRPASGGKRLLARGSNRIRLGIDLIERGPRDVDVFERLGVVGGIRGNSEPSHSRKCPSTPPETGPCGFVVNFQGNVFHDCAAQ